MSSKIVLDSDDIKIVKEGTIPVLAASPEYTYTYAILRKGVDLLGNVFWVKHETLSNDLGDAIERKLSHE